VFLAQNTTATFFTLSVQILSFSLLLMTALLPPCDLECFYHATMPNLHSPLSHLSSFLSPCTFQPSHLSQQYEFSNLGLISSPTKSTWIYGFTLPWNAALLNSPNSSLCTYNTPIGNCPPSDSHQRTCTVLLASISGECMDSIWPCYILSTTVLCTAMAV